MVQVSLEIIKSFEKKNILYLLNTKILAFRKLIYKNYFTYTIKFFICWLLPDPPK